MPHKHVHYDFNVKDFELFLTVNQVYRDYEEFIKNAVMPTIKTDFDIKIRELLVLICIDSAALPVTSADIANLMRKDPATMTRSTLTLIGKGFIESSRSHTDSRGKVLQMTEAGRGVIARYEKLFEDAKSLIDRQQDYAHRSAHLEELEGALHPLSQRAKLMAEASARKGFSEDIKEKNAAEQNTCSAIIY